jgi:hypothetical protein
VNEKIASYKENFATNLPWICTKKKKKSDIKPSKDLHLVNGKIASYEKILLQTFHGFAPRRRKNQIQNHLRICTL